MRFIFCPIGSSGDVNPFTGIAHCMRQRGHDVLMFTAEPFRPFVESQGIPFAPAISTDAYLRLTEDPALFHSARGIGVVLRAVADMLETVYQRLRECIEPGGTFLVNHPLGFPGRLLAEQGLARDASLALAPASLRSLERLPVLAHGVDLSPLPRIAKRMMWYLLDRFGLDPHYATALGRLRDTLGLPPIERAFDRWIWSDRALLGLFPDWFAPPQADWPAALELTGFPLFDGAPAHSSKAPARLPESLARHIQTHGPPIVVTPGTGNRHARALIEATVAGAVLLARPVVILTPFVEQLPRALPAIALHLPHVPLSPLLARSALIVHHGGIGTTAAALAAGISQVVAPFAFDQPDNAARVVRLGVARSIAARRATTQRLAGAMQAMLEDRCGQRTCASLQARLAESRPLEAAARALERAANI